MFDLDTLKVNPETAAKGAWVDYLSKSRLRVARSNNKEAEDYRLEKAIEHSEIFQSAGTGATPEEQRESQEKADKLAFEVENYVLAYFILKDWEGIKAGGKEIKYTPELGLKYLSDERFTDFREDVIKISRNRQHFRDKAETEATKTVKKAAGS